MGRQYVSDIAFTDSVKDFQKANGSREAYARMEQGVGWRTEVSEELSSFLADADMFYLATANADGQPYIQYRGGPPGFLRVLDAQTLAFADFAGNQQYISAGNLAENPKAFVFLIDYVNRRRIKAWGTARVVADDSELLERLSDPRYPAMPERVIVFSIEAWDVNCPQHIHVRIPVAEVEQLKARILELEARIKDSANDGELHPGNE